MSFDISCDGSYGYTENGKRNDARGPDLTSKNTVQSAEPGQRAHSETEASRRIVHSMRSEALGRIKKSTPRHPPHTRIDMRCATHGHGASFYSSTDFVAFPLFGFLFSIPDPVEGDSSRARIARAESCTLCVRHRRLTFLGDHYTSSRVRRLPPPSREELRSRSL